MPSTRQVYILPKLTELIEAATVRTVEILKTAINDRGIATIALSGGSTPKPLYQAIAQADLDWDKLHIFWGDERYVPSDHPDSNENMARQAWLNQVPLPPSNIHAVPTHLSNPADSALQYEATLKAVFGTAAFGTAAFGTKAGDFPAFDLILLGIGDDGHTASLFPHTPALDVRDRLVTIGEKSGQPRITFTYPLINNAHNVLFLLAGASKQPALQQIFSPEADSKQYPAHAIRPQGNLLWMMDQSAGEGILGMEGVPQL
jgi:6-phosphogluconolactonase